jgi:hypothetical protein
MREFWFCRDSMSSALAFWPKSGLSAWVTADIAAPYPVDFVFTKAYPTAEFGKVVVQLVCETKITGDANSDIIVTPQVSNDGVTWQDASPAFTKIEQGSTYPMNQVISVETVGQFMRFKIGFWEEYIDSDVTVIIGGNLLIEGTGKPV